MRSSFSRKVGSPSRHGRSQPDCAAKMLKRGKWRPYLSPLAAAKRERSTARPAFARCASYGGVEVRRSGGGEGGSAVGGGRLSVRTRVGRVLPLSWQPKARYPLARVGLHKHILTASEHAFRNRQDSPKQTRQFATGDRREDDHAWMRTSVGGKSHIVRAVDGDEHRSVTPRELEDPAVVGAGAKFPDLSCSLCGMAEPVRDANKSLAAALIDQQVHASLHAAGGSAVDHVAA